MMSWLTKLFGRRDATISDAERKKIRAFYDSAFKKARDAAVNRTLRDVRVRPGQDPYAAGFSALFAQEGNSQESAREDAKRKTMAKFRLSEHEFDSMVEDQ